MINHHRSKAQRSDSLLSPVDDGRFLRVYIRMLEDTPGAVA